MALKHIDPEVLRLLALYGHTSKLVQIKRVASARLESLGLTAEGVEPFAPRPLDPHESTLNERGIVDWIKSVSPPVRGDVGWLADEKTAQVALLKRLVATLKRLGD